MAVEAAEVSGWTLSVTWPVLALWRFRVTPGIAPVTVLEVLTIGILSTVSEAFWPAVTVVDPKPAEPLRVKPEAAPVVFDTIDRRVPFASVTTLAVTPRLSLLIWLAMLDSDW